MELINMGVLKLQKLPTHADKLKEFLNEHLRLLTNTNLMN